MKKEIIILICIVPILAISCGGSHHHKNVEHSHNNKDKLTIKKHKKRLSILERLAPKKTKNEVNHEEF
jgi:hypothetical protein